MISAFPSGGAITASQTVHLRSAPWKLDERKIIAVNGQIIFFDKPSSYPLWAGYGYYLTGSLWMLMNQENGIIILAAGFHIWMPDGQTPGNRVSLAALAAGIDLNNRSHVILDNLAIRRTGTAIRCEQRRNKGTQLIIIGYCPRGNRYSVPAME